MSSIDYESAVISVDSLVLNPDNPRFSYVLKNRSTEPSEEELCEILRNDRRNNECVNRYKRPNRTKIEHLPYFYYKQNRILYRNM